MLCRVARKLDVQDDRYQHSKKVIEVEYSQEFSDSILANEDVSIPQDDLDEVRGPGEDGKRSITVKRGDIVKYFKACTPRRRGKSASLNYPQFEEVGPSIPFGHRVKEEEYRSIPNPKSDGHPQLLARRNDTVVIQKPISNSLKEWREQKQLAAASMKKLKTVFPVLKPNVRKLLRVKVPHTISQEPINSKEMKICRDQAAETDVPEIEVGLAR